MNGHEIATRTLGFMQAGSSTVYVIYSKIALLIYKYKLIIRLYVLHSFGITIRWKQIIIIGFHFVNDSVDGSVFKGIVEEKNLLGSSNLSEWASNYSPPTSTDTLMLFLLINYNVIEEN